jgi:hypothetical protein
MRSSATVRNLTGMTYTPVDAMPTKQERFRNPNKSKNTNKIKQNYWMILLSSLDIAEQFIIILRCSAPKHFQVKKLTPTELDRGHIMTCI